MARKVAWGTPSRSRRFLVPRSPYTLVRVALGLALAVGALYLAMAAAGFRAPLAPGRLTSAHASFEARCEECHAPRAGAPSQRCQRCHDPAGSGRLTQSAHALFGRTDAMPAAAPAEIACARCHVEHQGRLTPLARVDPAQCFACHFSSFASHPEFAALRTPGRASPGIQFPHERHVKEYAKQGLADGQTCVKCHEPQKRDLAPIAFDRHCAACHAKEGSVGIVEPIPQEDAQPAGPPGEGFEIVGGQGSKAVVRHRDDWVRGSLERLRRELYPEGAEAAAAGALTAEVRRRKEESAEILATSCATCHVVEKAGILPVSAARRSLVRARFPHEPHLSQAECLKCHAGIERSREARDLVLPGVQSCRECHKPRAAPQSCETCHQFHPPVQP